MKYNVNVYQVVLTEERILINSTRNAFSRGMLGIIPSKEVFESEYKRVISFEFNDERYSENDTMKFCEECFKILNFIEEIDNCKEVSNFTVHDTFRSLSVGDILEINGELYIVKIFGFGKYLDEINSSENTSPDVDKQFLSQ